MSYIYDLTDTWDDAGTTFSAIKMNVTNTASAAASKLVQCQIGGTDKFTVGKDGGGYFAGNVGIGTTSPSAVGSRTTVNISGSSGSAIRLSDDTANAFIDYTDGSGARFSVNAAEPILLQTNSSERMRIDSSGNVGIGETSPGSWKLNVRSGGTNKLRLHNDTGNGNVIDFLDQAWQSQITGSAGILQFNTGGTTERMRIDSSGNVGIGTTSPDAKTNIVVSSTGRAWSPTAGFSDLVVERNANAGFTVVASNTANSYINFADTDDENAGMIVYQHSDNAMTFRTNGSGEDMRITSSGAVGVGTTSPSAKLDVVNGYVASRPALSSGAVVTAGVFAQATSSNPTVGQGSKIYIGGGANLLRLPSIAGVVDNGINGHALTFSSNPNGGSDTERMRLNSSGNLLLGTSSTFDNVSYLRGQFLGGLATKIAGTALTTQISFFNDNGRVGWIGTSGTTTSYNIMSDARLKENIADADDAANVIDAIQVRKFDWKADGSHQRYGMVAQELLEVAPEAVSGEPEGDEMMAVDYSKLVPMLIKEVQSLRARVAELETSASTITFEGN